MNPKFIIIISALLLSSAVFFLHLERVHKDDTRELENAKKQLEIIIENHDNIHFKLLGERDSIIFMYNNLLFNLQNVKEYSDSLLNDLEKKNIALDSFSDVQLLRFLAELDSLNN